MYRTYLLASVLTLLCSATSAQPNHLYEGGRQDPIVTSEQIEKLPVLRTRPRITLKHALKIAEGYSKRKKIALSSYFLFEAKVIQYSNDDKPRNPAWHFRWVNERAATPLKVEIIVSMQGSKTFVEIVKQGTD